MTTKVEKLTISVPRNLIEVTDEIAREQKTSRSKIIAACLQELAERRLREEMEAGYKALARENVKFAKDTLNATNEILPDWVQS